MGDRPANGDVTADVPPWQNSARRPAVSPAASRYVSGIAAPDLSGANASAKTEVGLIEAIPSELPDLSGSVPRPPQNRPAADQGRGFSSPQSPTAPTAVISAVGRARGPVRASMQIRRIDPWSALKVSLLLNVALFFIWMIAVAFLYLVLGAMGVWSKLNSNVGDLLTTTGGGGGGGDLVSAASIFGGAALIGLVNIVLLTAMATVGAYIYNLSTDIVGGVEVTLADLD
jgi:hypothetical protein